jgi:hypothetical protein
MEGWVKRKAQTKMGGWLARYMKVENGTVYFYDDEEAAADEEFTHSIALAADFEEARKGGASDGGAAGRKGFVIETAEGDELELRAADEGAVREWVDLLNEAAEKAREVEEARRKFNIEIRAKKAAQAKARASSAGARGGKAGAAGGRRRDDDSDSEAADSDEDSDASDGAPRLPPAPKWFKDYEGADEAVWMTATLVMLNRLFADIYEADGDTEGGVDNGDDGDRKVVMSKLAAATTKAWAELEDRVMQCRTRGRSDVIKHLISMFDLKFLQELTPLTTGIAPSRMSPKQLLQVIDCIEGFIKVRKRALGNMSLSQQEKRPGDVLRETRRDMINRYMDTIGPKLHGIAEKVLRNLFEKKADLVKRTVGTRVGTSSPTDLFNLMSEHLKIAKDGGSYTLQRRLLSAVTGEVVYYAREVLTDLMDWWTRDPSSVDMDYVTAVINDAGVMLDHLEQLESYFGEALKREGENVEGEISRSQSLRRAIETGLAERAKAASAAAAQRRELQNDKRKRKEQRRKEKEEAKKKKRAEKERKKKAKAKAKGKGGEEEGGSSDDDDDDKDDDDDPNMSHADMSGLADIDPFDLEEAEQAKEDLAAIEQDIPRAKSELLSSGYQLTGVLVDIVDADFRAPLSELFSSKWETGNQVSTIALTATDYFTEERALLDGYFYDRLVGMVLAHLTEQYLQRLLNSDILKKDKKIGFAGGFLTGKFKLSEGRLTKIVADAVELSNCFAAFMPREDIVLITQALTQVRETLTIDTENLQSVLELAIKSNPVVSTHVYMAFEKIVNMRDDLNKKERKAQLEQAQRTLLEFGQPPEDTDELLATGGMLGAGIMHGASMAQGIHWSPQGVTATIYRGLFPTAWDAAKTLFANWVPRQRAESHNISETPASFSMDAFAGGSTTGAGASANEDMRPMDISSFLGPSPVAGKKAGGGLKAFADEDSAPAPKKATPAPAPAPAPPKSSLFSAPSPRAVTRKKRRGDDDDSD